MIIDAHSHLWQRQDTTVDNWKICQMERNKSRSLFFGEERQMLPPFMIDGKNTAEVFLSNMDYAQVGGAVVVQEIIDGNQNDYLERVQANHPDRFFCMGMAFSKEEAEGCHARGFRGIALPAHRLKESLLSLMPMFRYMEEKRMILSICLADDEKQVGEMAEVIQSCLELKVAIGHFGFVTMPTFRQQILLCREGENVMVESGGITWLYNSEFYPFPSAVRSIKEAAELVGMDRLMWGSDYPRTITAITYRMSYDFIAKTNELNEEEKKMFLGRNAKTFYGFGELPFLPYIKNMSE